MVVQARKVASFWGVWNFERALPLCVAGGLAVAGEHEKRRVRLAAFDGVHDAFLFLLIAQQAQPNVLGHFFAAFVLFGLKCRVALGVRWAA